MRCSHSVRWPTSVVRARTFTRQVQGVRRRDPRLRQAVLREQLAQQPGVELVGLRAPLALLASLRLGRLGELASTPARVHSSATKRQPVIASTATTVGVSV
jgi:hypothetical protein